MFDEFNDVRHEFRAFQDFLAAFPLQYELIAEVNGHAQVGLRVK